MKDLIYNWLYLPPETPLYLVPLIGLVTCFFYFAILFTFKKWLVARGWENNKIARTAFYLLGLKFLRLDVVANILCFSIIAWHRPKRFGEDLTITAHANAIIGHYYPIRNELNWRKRWALAVSLFICKALNHIDTGHCSNYEELKNG